mgnify:CR=1 FL=1
MNFEEVIKVITVCGSLLISLGGFVVALVRDIRTKKWSVLKTELITFITKAEKMKDMTGAEKKSAVLSWAEEYCKSHDIKFDAQRVSLEIEELIYFTKNVNKRDTTASIQSIDVQRTLVPKGK